VKVPKVKAPKPEIACVLGTRIEPGDYRAYVRAADWYFDRGFRRWTCILKFDVYDDRDNLVARKIPMWMNLGRGDRPKAGRRSRYFDEWFRANGAAPNRADRLSPQVFVKRMARVRISDSIGNVPYSVVREILAWETGSLQHQPAETVLRRAAGASKSPTVNRNKRSRE
jgi:hypothetical protein